MLIVLMGVSGSGKTTTGRLLASRLGCPFLEADDFHPRANREKLAAGIPLTDDDRWPWLAALNAGLLDAVRQTDTVILACSALKDAYRDRLDDGLPPIRWVHLIGDRDLLEERLHHRIGHFSSESILPSQFATLEPPDDAVEIRVDGTPAQVVEQTARCLGVTDVDPRICDRLIARHILTDGSAPSSGSARTDNLLGGDQFRPARNGSLDAATPPGEWYCQQQPEWVLLLAGQAGLLFENDENPFDIAPGDAWLIPAQLKHRVEWTDPDEPSIWLAIHFDA